MEEKGIILETQTDIKSLSDERIQFLPKAQRKQVKKMIKNERRQTKVIFSGMYARRSIRGNSLIVTIPKEEVKESGLRLSLNNSDLIDYIEDLNPTVPIFKIVGNYEYETEKETSNASPS